MNIILAEDNSLHMIAHRQERKEKEADKEEITIIISDRMKITNTKPIQGEEKEITNTHNTTHLPMTLE